MQPSASRSSTRYRIADLVFDIGQRQIHRGREVIPVSGLPFAILRALVETAPNVVTHDELTQKAWGTGRIVTPETVAQHIKRLRRLLGDDAGNPRYIAAVRGEGYRILPAVTVEMFEPAPPGHAPRRATPGWMLGAALAGLAVVLAGALWVLPLENQEPPSESPAGIAPPIQMALLPFTSIGAGEIDGAPVEVVFERLHSALGELDGLRMADRRTSLDLAQTDTRAIFDLGFDYVLDGTIMRADQRLHVRPQLVHAETQIVLWSGVFDVPLGSVDAIADTSADIVSIVGSLLDVGGQWSELLGRPLDPRLVDNVLLFLRAQGPSREAQLEAIGHLESARREVPNDGTLHATLSVFYADIALTFPDRERAAEFWARADAAMASALEHEPDLPFVQFIAANGHARKGNWNEAAEIFRNLVDSIGPDTLRHDMFDFYGLFLRSVGRLEDARSHFEFRQRIAPENVDNVWRLIETHAALGDFDAAFRLAEEHWQRGMLVSTAALTAALGARDRERIELWLGRIAQDLDSSDLNVQMASRLDDKAAAIEVLRERMRTADRASGSTLAPIVTWAAYFGDHRLALDALAQTPEATRGLYVSLHIWRPVMAGVRQLPEFKRLIIETGLIGYWQEWGWPTLCHEVEATVFECA